MTDNTVVMTDLDRLTERVEKAASLIQQLRDERAQFEQERNELASKLADLERKLQGNDATALVHELSLLRKEQRDSQTERRDVASKIDVLVKKLERLEG